MSKLSIVRKALESNPKLTIVNIFERNYNPKVFFCHTVDFWVAPKKGLYFAKDLQKFMEGLIPGLEPTQQDRFLPSTPGCCMNLGKLYFDEDVEGNTRRTWVRPFPNELFAKAVLSGELKYSQYRARLGDLELYKDRYDNILKKEIGTLNFSKQSQEQGSMILVPKGGELSF